MEMRYRELIGREVVAPSGKRLGRIADLEAERAGDELCVVALLVGPLALFGRIWSPRIGGLRLRPHRVPWEDVVQIGRRVQLSSESLQDAAPPVAGPVRRIDR